MKLREKWNARLAQDAPERQRRGRIVISCCNAGEIGKTPPVSWGSQLQTRTVTDRTICNRLLEAGYPARAPLKKPLLNNDQSRKRLQWAKAHKDWDVERWRKVLWSDETSFSLFPLPGNVKSEENPRKSEGIA